MKDKRTKAELLEAVRCLEEDLDVARGQSDRYANNAHELRVELGDVRKDRDALLKDVESLRRVLNRATALIGRMVAAGDYRIMTEAAFLELGKGGDVLGPIYDGTAPQWHREYTCNDEGQWMVVKYPPQESTP